MESFGFISVMTVFITFIGGLIMSLRIGVLTHIVCDCCGRRCRGGGGCRRHRGHRVLR